MLNKNDDLLNFAPKWEKDAKQYLKDWVEMKGFFKENPKNIDGNIMLQNMYLNHCSQKSFMQVINKFKHIKKLLKVDLNELTGLVVGGDWGTKYLYACQALLINKLVVVDIDGKYGQISEKILAKYPDEHFEMKYLNAMQIANAYGSKMDFIYITPSYGHILKNNADSWEEIIQLTKALKIGGLIFIDLPSSRNHYLINRDRIQAILNNIGFEAIYKSLLHDLSIALNKVENISERTVNKLIDSIEGELYTQYGRNLKQEFFDNIKTIPENVDSIYLAISNKSLELKSFPTRMKINMGSKCNIRCMYCGYPEIVRHWQIPKFFVNDLVKHIDTMITIFLTGGEPLLMETTTKLLEASASLNEPNIELVSNLNIKKDSMLELIVKGTKFITCSIDAANVNTYSLLRQGGNWDTVMYNLEHMVVLKKKFGQTYPIIEINFIVNKLNYLEIIKFYELALKLGVNSISFKWMSDVQTPRMKKNAIIYFDKDQDVVLNILNSLTAILEHSLKNKVSIYIQFNDVVCYIKAYAPQLWKVFDKKSVFGFHGYFTNIKVGEYSMNHFMPDKLMPCIAPFCNLQFKFECVSFCCRSLGEYSSVKIDYEDGFYAAWNNEKFKDARKYFLRGEYDKVCRKDCIAYQVYLENRLKSTLEVKDSVSLKS